MPYRLYIPVLCAALLLASCAKDQPESAPESETPPTTVSFTYKSYRSALSRATVPALDAEKAVFDMDIFVRSGGQFVRRLVPDTDYTETTSGDNSTIHLTTHFISEFAGQKVVFYFVANNASSVGGTHVASFSGTQQQFEDLRTTELGDSPWYAPGEKAQLICTQDDFYGNTYGLLMTAKSNEILIAGKRSATVTLKRRVARFDVRNAVPEYYAIEMIYVSNAKVQAPMFVSSSADHSPIATRSLEEIYGPHAGQYDQTTKIAPCVFYLYPTDLDTTTIVADVKNLSTGKTTPFAVNSNMKIEANKRYIIWFDEDKLEIGAGPGDWDNP